MRAIRGSRAKAPFPPHRRPGLHAGRMKPVWKRRLEALHARQDRRAQERIYLRWQRDGDLLAPCWCGEKAPAYQHQFLDETCGGTGALYCYCGGDQCVCHFHGETQCDGCEDCQQEAYDR